MTTLLQGINDVLRRVGKIAGDAGELASLTDSPRQHYVDTAVDAWNDCNLDFFRKIDRPRPNILAEDTITLVTGDRDYALASDLSIFMWPLHDETNGQYIVEFPSGYHAMTISQPFPANETGLPISGAIRPTDGQLYLDAIPTADENGRVYKYRYRKGVVATAAADVLPYRDEVATALVGAVAEYWRRENRENADDSKIDASMARAAYYIRTMPQSETWLRRD